MTDRHKALTVRAPWAQLIATGRKRVELRAQRTHYRGPLLICCGLREGNVQTVLPCVGEDELAAALAPELRGQALCLVDVVDSRPALDADALDACSPVKGGQWAWVLANPRPVERAPVSGKQGFFWVELPCAPLRRQ